MKNVVRRRCEGMPLVSDRPACVVIATMRPVTRRVPEAGRSRAGEFDRRFASVREGDAEVIVRAAPRRGPPCVLDAGLRERTGSGIGGLVGERERARRIRVERGRVGIFHDEEDAGDRQPRDAEREVQERVPSDPPRGGAVRRKRRHRGDRDEPVADRGQYGKGDCGDRNRIDERADIDRVAVDHAEIRGNADQKQRAYGHDQARQRRRIGSVDHRNRLGRGRIVLVVSADVAGEAVRMGGL